MNLDPHEEGRALSGRAVAIAVVTVVSAACFALGFFVGRAISRSHLDEAGVAAPREEAAVYGLEEAVLESPAGSSAPAGPDEAPEGAPVEGAPVPGEATKTYSVQVGAYLNGKAAEALASRLRNKGYEAYILKTATPDDRTIYKVRVGRFADRREAEFMARKIEKAAAGESIVTSN